MIKRNGNHINYHCMYNNLMTLHLFTFSFSLNRRIFAMEREKLNFWYLNVDLIVFDVEREKTMWMKLGLKALKG